MDTAVALRRSGIDVVGDVPWGTHFCHFYETREDLLDTLVPYFKAGLEAGEFCVWVVSEPLTIGEAWGGLREHVPGLDRYVARHSIEVFPARDWYLRQGEFDLHRVTAAWNDKLERALARGYPGMRVSGNAAWLEKKDWRDFCQYEEQLHHSIGNQRMAMLCPYPLTATGALDLLDVVRNHRFTIAKRRGNWEVVETFELQKVKAHIEALNKDLERRVAERTEQLEATNEELRSEIDERTRSEAQLEAVRDALDADLTAMTRLHEFSTRLLASSDLDDLLDEALDAVIGLQGADFGNIQLYNPKTRALEIVTQRGFSSDFLEHFSRVEDGEDACGRALARGDRAIIEDVELDPGFASHRRIAATAGFRAVQSTPLLSRSGEPLGMICTHFRRPHRPSERDLQLTDLHVRQASEMIERKRAEEALRQSEAQFRLLGEAIPQQVWSHLPDGSINYCNRRWTDYSGLTREETRDGWVGCLHPEDRERVMTAWNEALGRSTPYEGEFRIRGADGGYRRFLSRAVPVRDERGHVVQWFGTNTDLEERKQAEEALHRAQTEIARFARLTTLGELTASLAHELSQPLAAVVTNGSACLRWLDRPNPELGEAMSAVQRIIRDANRAAEVMSHTRGFLRKSAEERIPLGVGDVIREVIVLVEPEARRHRAAIRVSVSEYLPLVTGDRIQLQQVVLNLMLNGIEAMADVADRPRELVISAEPGELDGRRVVQVAVADAGAGLTAEALERLFEAFYTTKPGGLGMGLSISRSIIESHGGHLWAAQSPGHGATLYFTLPAASDGGA